MPLGEKRAKVRVGKQKRPHGDGFARGRNVSEAGVVPMNSIGRESFGNVSDSVSKSRGNQDAIHRSAYLRRQGKQILQETPANRRRIWHTKEATARPGQW